MNLSASKLRDFDTCSMLFWLKNIENLPERIHPKTKIGSLVHRLFELLMAKKRQKKMKLVFVHGFFLEDFPSIKRFIRFYCAKHGIDLAAIKSDIDEIGDMLAVAFLSISKYFLSPTFMDYFTEQRFEIDKDGKRTGIIDLLIVYKDHLIVIDLKSQAQKFTKADLPNNVQAAIYQWYCWEHYKLPATVIFVLVRHAPTSRTPDKHLQIVEPKTELQLLGLDSLCELSYGWMNNFSYQDALTHLCHDDNFCEYKCGYKKPFDYQCVMKDGKVVRNYLADAKVELKVGETIETKRHLGCIRFN